ncbi:MAG: DUF456 domain-containing protein [Deltaproteobacteria bacterium]|nr:DUF456 domain-containing protein [Deltaproteobacteria bacterium]
METVGFILLLFFFLVGFFAIFFGLPGTWLILVTSFLYGYADSFEKLGLTLLAVLAVIAVAAEGLEYLLGMAGAKRFGASRKGAVASLVGGIIGAVLCAPLFFGIGALPGLFAGAFFGAFFYEWTTQRDLRHSFRSGVGAFLGRVSGTMVKLLAALGMIGTVLFALR